MGSRRFLVALLTVTAASANEIAPQRQQELSNLLRQDCGSCHGLLFKGGLGPPLLPDDLSTRSDAVLVDTILNGRPRTAMPPWREFLSPSEAAWIVEKLRKNTP